jgi:hypothetical protein
MRKPGPLLARPSSSSSPSICQTTRELNGIIYTAIQGVESGRLTGEQAADFVIDEASSTLDDVVVK